MHVYIKLKILLHVYFLIFQLNQTISALVLSIKPNNISSSMTCMKSYYYYYFCERSLSIIGNHIFWQRYFTYCSTIYYGEYRCIGEGAVSSGRVKFQKILSVWWRSKALHEHGLYSWRKVGCPTSKALIRTTTNHVTLIIIRECSHTYECFVILLFYLFIMRQVKKMFNT